VWREGAETFVVGADEEGATDLDDEKRVHNLSYRAPAFWQCFIPTRWSRRVSLGLDSGVLRDQICTT